MAPDGQDTDMTLQVIAKPPPNQVIGLLLLSQAVEDQPLHGQRLCKMRGEQDVFCGGGVTPGRASLGTGMIIKHVSHHGVKVTPDLH